MSLPDALIIVAAILDVLALILLVVVALRFRALADAGKRSAEPLRSESMKMAATLRRITETSRNRKTAILGVLEELSRRISSRVATTRRMVAAVVHPEPAAPATIARAVEQGVAWTERLGRLRDAARRAAGANGSRRRPV
jgi:hypothetical protein